jgi:hypothetical protein
MCTYDIYDGLSIRLKLIVLSMSQLTILEYLRSTSTLINLEKIQSRHFDRHGHFLLGGLIQSNLYNSQVPEVFKKTQDV